jgi:hypothetical protein
VDLLGVYLRLTYSIVDNPGKEIVKATPARVVQVQASPDLNPYHGYDLINLHVLIDTSAENKSPDKGVAGIKDFLQDEIALFLLPLHDEGKDFVLVKYLL